jgi:hypothetical protein
VAEVPPNLDEDFKVSGLVMPSSRLEAITKDPLNMASLDKLECSSCVDNIQFYRKSNATRAAFSCKYGKALSNGSSKSVELEGLKQDLSEFTEFHIAERPTVKVVIQMDINLIWRR